MKIGFLQYDVTHHAEKNIECIMSALQNTVLKCWFFRNYLYADICSVAAMNFLPVPNLFRQEPPLNE